MVHLRIHKRRHHHTAAKLTTGKRQLSPLSRLLSQFQNKNKESSKKTSRTEFVPPSQTRQGPFQRRVSHDRLRSADGALAGTQQCRAWHTLRARPPEYLYKHDCIKFRYCCACVCTVVFFVINEFFDSNQIEQLQNGRRLANGTTHRHELR